jgi:hypothetical protein
MKMSHLYFDKYCTRTVQSEKAPGLFTFDGETISREYLEDPQKHKSLKETILRNQLSIDVQQQTLQHNTQSKSITKATNVSSNVRIVQPKLRSVHPEEMMEIRAKEVSLLKHIYHDDNFVRLQAEKRQVVTTGSRTWLPAEKLLRSTEAAHKCVVTTSVPPNRTRLGLTPLRAHGSGGQDKPHHVPVSHNVMRMKIT